MSLLSAPIAMAPEPPRPQSSPTAPSSESASSTTGERAPTAPPPETTSPSPRGDEIACSSSRSLLPDLDPVPTTGERTAQAARFVPNGIHVPSGGPSLSFVPRAGASPRGSPLQALCNIWTAPMRPGPAAAAADGSVAPEGSGADPAASSGGSAGSSSGPPAVPRIGDAPLLAPPGRRRSECRRSRRLSCSDPNLLLLKTRAAFYVETFKKGAAAGAGAVRELQRRGGGREAGDQGVKKEETGGASGGEGAGEGGAQQTQQPTLRPSHSSREMLRRLMSQPVIDWEKVRQAQRDHYTALSRETTATESMRRINSATGSYGTWGLRRSLERLEKALAEGGNRPGRNESWGVPPPPPGPYSNRLPPGCSHAARRAAMAAFASVSRGGTGTKNERWAGGAASKSMLSLATQKPPAPPSPAAAAVPFLSRPPAADGMRLPPAHSAMGAPPPPPPRAHPHPPHGGLALKRAPSSAAAVVASAHMHARHRGTHHHQHAHHGSSVMDVFARAAAEGPGSSAADLFQSLLRHSRDSGSSVSSNGSTEGESSVGEGVGGGSEAGARAGAVGAARGCVRGHGLTLVRPPRRVGIGTEGEATSLGTSQIRLQLALRRARSPEEGDGANESKTGHGLLLAKGPVGTKGDNATSAGGSGGGGRKPRGRRPSWSAPNLPSSDFMAMTGGGKMSPPPPPRNLARAEATGPPQSEVGPAEATGPPPVGQVGGAPKGFAEKVAMAATAAGTGTIVVPTSQASPLSALPTHKRPILSPGSHTRRWDDETGGPDAPPPRPAEGGTFKLLLPPPGAVVPLIFSEARRAEAGDAAAADPRESPHKKLRLR